VVLDNGAINALINKGASLLPSGIINVSGEFFAGDSINLINAENKKIIAKGICQYSGNELAQIKGCNSDKIHQILGYCNSQVVIHRNDLVIL
jgi:glutamate 5-kinase